MNAYLWGATAFVCALAACAQGGVDRPTTSAQSQRASDSLTTTPTPPLRVIVQFSPPTPMQDEALLQSLQAQTQAKVRFITAMSKDTHVYLFQPASGQTQAQLLQRLGAMPSVLRAELDLKAKPH